MSRRTPSLLALVLLVVALTAACADATAPAPAAELPVYELCDRTSNGTCTGT